MSICSVSRDSISVSLRRVIRKGEQLIPIEEDPTGSFGFYLLPASTVSGDEGRYIIYKDPQSLRFTVKVSIGQVKKFIFDADEAERIVRSHKDTIVDLAALCVI